MENSELIAKALSYVESESGNTDMTVESVAEHAGFSADYFNRIFAAHTGFRVMEYVRFVRLRRASLKLRTTDESILDIALSCGYDSHESFSRAFKNQYGRTPSEYRETMKAVEPLYGEYHNETVGARLVHEFPELKIADTDDAIDFLLAKNAVKYGYVAVCFQVNGGAALYAGERMEDGFVWVTEWEGKFGIEIISENYDVIAEYCRLFRGDRFNVTLYTLDESETILSELFKRGIRYDSASIHNQAIYRGGKFALDTPEGMMMRELTSADYNLIEKYFIEKEEVLTPQRKAMLSFVRRELQAKYEYGNREHPVFLFGIFIGEHLVGISFGGLQCVHGFTVNNCVETSLLNAYESEKIQKYAFQFVTNAAILAGALPFDDIRCNEHTNPSATFNSVDLGYEIVLKSCTLR